MYSFSPLPPVDTLHIHYGLIFIFGSICTLSLFVYLAFKEFKSFQNKFYLSCAFILCVASYFSFTEGKVIVYENKQVVGKFVKFIAEGYNEEYRSGKTTQRVDRHLLYVVYEVEGEQVILTANDGFMYPQKAILYKN